MADDGAHESERNRRKNQDGLEVGPQTGGEHGVGREQGQQPGAIQILAELGLLARCSQQAVLHARIRGQNSRHRGLGNQRLYLVLSHHPGIDVGGDGDLALSIAAIDR